MWHGLVGFTTCSKTRAKRRRRTRIQHSRADTVWIKNIHSSCLKHAHLILQRPTSSGQDNLHHCYCCTILSKQPCLQKGKCLGNIYMQIENYADRNENNFQKWELAIWSTRRETICPTIQTHRRLGNIEMEPTDGKTVYRKLCVKMLFRLRSWNLTWAKNTGERYSRNDNKIIPIGRLLSLMNDLTLFHPSMEPS